MNKFRKVAMLLLGLYECLFFGGVIFGWVSLVVVFESEKYFSDGCGFEPPVNTSHSLSRRSDTGNLSDTTATSVLLTTNITTTMASSLVLTTTVLSQQLTSAVTTDVYQAETTVGGEDSPGSEVKMFESCPSQEEHLQLVFTIATFTLNALTLINGYMFDRFGTRKTRIFAMFGYLSGTLMLAFSNKELSVLLYPAMTLIAVCGIILLITNIQIGNVFSSRRATVITMFNGAFDSSSFVFLIFKFVYQSGIALQHIFFAFSGMMIVFLINTFYLMPAHRIPWPLPQDWGERKREEPEMQILDDSEKRLRNPRLSLDGEMQDGEAWTMRNGDSKKKATEHYERKVKQPPTPSFATMATSGLYLWSVVWLSIMQLKVWFFIGTLKAFLESMATKNPSIVDSYLTIFGFVQFGGIFVAPLVGMAVDRNKRKHKRLVKMKRQHSSYDVSVPKRTTLDDLEDIILPVTVTCTIGVLFSVSAVIPFMPIQIFTFIAKVVMRAFLYALNAAFLATAFPQQHFGKLYGLSMFISGIIGALQFPLFIWVQGSLNRDPLYVNLLLLFVGLITYIFPFVIRLYVKRGKRKELAAAILDDDIVDNGCHGDDEHKYNSVVNGNVILDSEKDETNC